MRKSLVWMAMLGLLLGSTVLAYGVVTGAVRSDCPGRITCPLTGEAVCQDQCPLVDAQRPDCPGKIECPLTGELVCKDECPIGHTSETVQAVPACCQSAK